MGGNFMGHGDLRVQRALAILKDLLDALALHGDDEEEMISKEAARWVQVCERLGVDFSAEPFEKLGADVSEGSPQPSRGASPPASSI